MTLIAFDPDVEKSAYSLWKGEDLVEVGKITRDKDFLTNLMTLAKNHYEPGSVCVIEGQWMHPKASKRNILTFQRLVEVREEIATIFSLTHWQIKVVAPQRWQIDILRCNRFTRRAQRKLLSQFVAKPYLELLPSSYRVYIGDHNIADAICIGLWGVHRFPLHAPELPKNIVTF